MLTKEEYHEYLNVICDNWKDNSSDGCQMFDTICDAFEQLIQEHFDNPPLSFDDLKEGMWVWDSKLKIPYKIEKMRKGKWFKAGYRSFVINIGTGKRYYYTGLMGFEENRFYRRQKEVNSNA